MTNPSRGLLLAAALLIERLADAHDVDLEETTVDIDVGKDGERRTVAQIPAASLLEKMRSAAAEPERAA